MPELIASYVKQSTLAEKFTNLANQITTREQKILSFTQRIYK